MGAAANCATRRVANTFIIYSGSSLRGSRNERMRIAGLRAPRLRPARFSEPQNSRASANPAAETISDKGRSKRRSVKNRRTFSISRVQSRTCSSFAEARKRLRSELLIASKVPKASDLAQSRERPRNRFTAAAFRLPFGRAKGNGYFYTFSLRPAYSPPSTKSRMASAVFCGSSMKPMWPEFSSHTTRACGLSATIFSAAARGM